MKRGAHRSREGRVPRASRLPGALAWAAAGVLLLLPGCAPSSQRPRSLPFTQTQVGDRANLTRNGARWGENIAKIARHGRTTFTFAFVAGEDQQPTACLYQKEDGGAWVEGQRFAFSRPPNLLVDSGGHVHLIGFERLDPSAQEHDGRISHVRFVDAGTVAGAFEKRFITQDWRPVPAVDTYATYYTGAAIGADDTLLVVYNNSTLFNVPNENSLGARIRNPSTGAWTYESIALNMKSRHGYPFAFVSDTHFHVLSVEDDQDPALMALGGRYAGYPYRYGEVSHYQRPRSGGPWTQTTLLQLNDQPWISKADIWKMRLRIDDLHVDSAGTIHALVVHTGDYTGSAVTDDGRRRWVHYFKTLDAKAWTHEPVADDELAWVRIWERKDGRLFYFGCDSRGRVWATPLGAPGQTRHPISRLSIWARMGSTPFLAGPRSGVALSDDLHAVIYSGGSAVPAVALEASLSGL